MAFGGFAPMPIRLGGGSLEGWPPEQHARFCADLVAVKLTSHLARFTFVKAGATITIADAQVMNGAGSAFAPVGTDGGTGIAKFSFASPSFEDPYGVAYGVKIRHARVRCHGSTELRGTYLLNTLSSQLVVYLWNSANAAADGEATVTLW